MPEIWWTVIGLAVLTVLIKGSGTLMLGHRELPAWAPRVIEVLPGALLTALIVVQVFGSGKQVEIDERLIGILAAAGVLFWRRNALILSMLTAAVTVALLRAFL